MPGDDTIEIMLVVLPFEEVNLLMFVVLLIADSAPESHGAANQPGVKPKETHSVDKSGRSTGQT